MDAKRTPIIEKKAHILAMTREDDVGVSLVSMARPRSSRPSGNPKSPPDNNSAKRDIPPSLGPVIVDAGCSGRQELHSPARFSRLSSPSRWQGRLAIRL